MASSIPYLQKQLNHAWEAIVASLAIISNISEVRPKQAVDIFRYAPAPGKVRVAVEPISLRVTRKANGTKADLYVALGGWIEFHDRDITTDLRSFAFKTEVGYFVEKSSSELKHQFGVHYDYDGRLVAHPVYHAQIAPMMGFLRTINDEYDRTFSIAENDVAPIIGNVRIPTAQMDVFSVLLQIASDHLMSIQATTVAQEAYEKLKFACGFFECDGRSIERFGPALERGSYRSYRWYQ